MSRKTDAESPRRAASSWSSAIRGSLWPVRRWVEGSQFERHGRVPWSPGYDEHKRRFLAATIDDEALLERFRTGAALPANHGVGIDERSVEYPWLLAWLGCRPGVLLDAGSALNHEFLLSHPALRAREIHIVTLAPEVESFVGRGISYLFHDLRDLPLRSDFYDDVACVSTLEHVGFDNTAYTHDEAHREQRPDDFRLVMRELNRVLKPGGRLYLTVPFGVPRRFGSFRPFDRALLDAAVAAFGGSTEMREAFYRYTAEGWQRADADDCAACEYVEWITRPHDQWPRPTPVEPDRAAAARAVACVRLVKP